MNTLTPLPNAQQSWEYELSNALTDRQNSALYDMLVDATLAQIKVESFLCDYQLSIGPAFDRASGTVQDLLDVRQDLTAAWLR